MNATTQQCFLFFVPFLLFLSACGGSEVPMFEQLPITSDPFSPDAAIVDAAHDTVRAPPWFADPDAAPDTLPTGIDPNGYATELRLISGCEMDVGTITVAARHDQPAECEHIVAIPVGDDHGDMVQIVRPIEWTLLNPTVATVSCQNGPQDDFCWANGLQDIVDTHGAKEPGAIIWACALNSCPVPRPTDCEDKICKAVVAHVAINIEGSWSLTRDSISQPVGLHVQQDGSSFTDPTKGVWHGVVQNTTVQFELDDKRYDGTIADDRASMNGTAKDLMSDMPVGSWFATRATP